MPCPSHTPWLDWRRVQVMKLLIMQFSPTSRHFISLRSKDSPQRPVKVPNLMSIFFSLGRLSKESVQIRGPSWHFVTSLFFTVRGFQPHAQPNPWRTTPYRLFATAYLIYSQLSGGRLLHPQPEDAPCRGDKGPTWHGIKANISKNK
jgi:hypothetical protein